ncbi:hypothetical protein U1Q18_040232 [Sarracenia purpurea var. burkii]
MCGENGSKSYQSLWVCLILSQFKLLSLDMVLSDPQKRAVYDQYGEEGLKGQVSPPDAGGPGGATFFSTSSGPTTLRPNPRNTNDIFADFFGNNWGRHERWWIEVREPI